MDMNDFLNEFYKDLEEHTNKKYSNKIQKLIEEDNFTVEELTQLLKKNSR